MRFDLSRSLFGFGLYSTAKFLINFVDCHLCAYIRIFDKPFGELFLGSYFKFVTRLLSIIIETIKGSAAESLYFSNFFVPVLFK